MYQVAYPGIGGQAMGKSDSRTGIEDSYYECTDCGYRASVAIGIGMCPLCGDAISETGGLA
jgi:rubrerythrin